MKRAMVVSILFIVVHSTIFGQINRPDSSSTSSYDDKAIFLQTHLLKNKVWAMRGDQRLEIDKLAEFFADSPNAQQIVVNAQSKAEKYQIVLILMTAATFVAASEGYDSDNDVLFTTGVFGTMVNMFVAQVVGRKYRNEIRRAIYVYNRDMLTR